MRGDDDAVIGKLAEDDHSFLGTNSDRISTL
jgi:hypothetical protein